MTGAETKGIDRRTQPPEESRAMMPGSLFTSLHPSAIGEENAQAMMNCYTERGVFELDKRYRQFQPAHASSPQVMCLAAGIPAQEIVAICNGTARKVVASSVWSADGTVSQWSGSLVNGTGLAAGNWQSWVHDKWMFFTHPTGGVRYVELGTNELKTLYRNYDINTQGTWAIDRPPYPSQEWNSGTDTIVNGPATSGGTWSIANNNLQLVATNDPTGYWDTYHSGEATYGTSIDLSQVDYIGFTISMLQGNYLTLTAPMVKVKTTTFNTAATAKNCPVRFSRDSVGRTMQVWVDLTGISRTARTQVTGWVFGVTMWRDGPDGFSISPLILGGTFMQSLNGGKIENANAAAVEDIDYAYTYIKADNTGESGGTLVTVNGPATMGTRRDGTLPYMGAHVALSIGVNGDPPYDGTSKIRVYRKVASVWYRIDDDSILNAGSPAWIDRLTSDQVRLLSANPNLTIGTIDASASGAVTDIVGGISWRGSNTYFGQNGKVYFSRVNKFTDVLWDQITIDNAKDDDTGRPRTLQGDPEMAGKIIAAVSLDALHLFTRNRYIGIVGDKPSQASYPRVMYAGKGVVGPRGATAFADGALFASDDGLYFGNIASAFSGASRSPIEEVTKFVRPTYQTVIGTSSATKAKTIVVTHEADIWIICETRFLHLTQEKRWIYGEFSHEVVDARSDPEYGILLQLSTGKMAQIGSYKTDLGTNVAGDNGTVVRWSYTGKLYYGATNILRAQTMVERAAGTPNVTATVYSEDSPAGRTVTANETGFMDLPFPRHMDPTTQIRYKSGGHYFFCKLEGDGTDVVTRFALGIASAEGRK